MTKPKTPGKSEDQAIDQVVNIIRFMGENRLAEIELETADLKLSLKKHVASHTQAVQQQMAMPMSVMQIESAIRRQPEKPVAHDIKAAAPTNYQTVVSPMTGTFYRAPSPDSQPFMKEGDVIKAGQTICIVEAMKMMNEIKSDKAGKIVKILIENGKPVEKGTVLVHLGE